MIIFYNVFHSQVSDRMKRCIICNRRLKTGRKYCYDCKSGGRLRKRRNRRANKFDLFALIFMVILIGLLLLAMGQYKYGGIFLILGLLGIIYYIKKKKKTIKVIDY